MSYLFDGANDTMTGTFTSTYADPVTLACWIKITAHPVAADALIYFGNSSSSTDESYATRTSTTDDAWSAISRTTLNGTATLSDVNVDGVWAPIVGVFVSDDLRYIYAKSPQLVASDTTSRAVADVLQFVRLGETFTAAQDFTGRMAEVAIWNVGLTTKDVTRYMVGVSASIIQPANLIGYWPLIVDSSTQQNLGVDATGDLTVTSALVDADHPIIYAYDTVNVPGQRVFRM
jgi:hypothetical protein